MRTPIEEIDGLLKIGRNCLENNGWKKDDETWEFVDQLLEERAALLAIPTPKTNPFGAEASTSVAP